MSDEPQEMTEFLVPAKMLDTIQQIAAKTGKSPDDIVCDAIDFFEQHVSTTSKED